MMYYRVDPNRICALIIITSMIVLSSFNVPLDAQMVVPPMADSPNMIANNLTDPILMGNNLTDPILMGNNLTDPMFDP